MARDLKTRHPLPDEIFGPTRRGQTAAKGEVRSLPLRVRAEVRVGDELWARSSPKSQRSRLW